VNILLPGCFIEVRRQKPASFIGQHGINANRKIAHRSILRIDALQVIAYHQVCDWEKFTMPAIFTANSWFFANPTDPLILANRLVALFASFQAFKAPRINILTPMEQAAKEGYLLILG
jgi:hypothetical protein